MACVRIHATFHIQCAKLPIAQPTVCMRKSCIRKPDNRMHRKKIMNADEMELIAIVKRGFPPPRGKHSGECN